jgi:cytochrome c-type biogenesis protein CcmF
VFSSTPRSAGQQFYNHVVAPTGIAAAALMALAPLLAYGRDAAAALRRGFPIPGSAAAAIVALALLSGVRNPTALASAGVAAFAVVAILAGFLRSVRATARHSRLTIPGAALVVVDSNHRRYGGQIAHLGVILIILGVAGSSLFSLHRSVSLKPGDQVAIGRSTLRYDSLEEFASSAYTGVRATVSLLRPGAPPVVLSPERRFYDTSRQTSAEVAIRSNWREDLYVALVGWEGENGAIALQIHVNPMTSWIWAGSAGVLLGGVFCLLPRLLPRTAARARPAPVARLRPARCPAPVHQ